MKIRIGASAAVVEESWEQRYERLKASTKGGKCGRCGKGHSNWGDLCSECLPSFMEAIREWTARKAIEAPAGTVRPGAAWR